VEQALLAPWKRHLILASGLVLLLSSLAHSLLGWKQIGAELAAAGTPPDLTGALAAGWHFGGVAMAAFAAIVLIAWRRARAGDPSGLVVAQVVGATYLAFGTAAFVLRSFDPFFMIFVLPGAALFFCARGVRRDGRRPAA
jgi:hypothetical protein